MQAIIPYPVKLSLGFLIFFVVLLGLIQCYSYNFKSDEEITKFVQKVGITKGKSVRLKNVANDKKRQHEQLITREESTKSEAIISLSINNKFKGLILFESAKESTFSVDQSTDYLEFFAQITSKHLESLINK